MRKIIAPVLLAACFGAVSFGAAADDRDHGHDHDRGRPPQDYQGHRPPPPAAHRPPPRYGPGYQWHNGDEWRRAHATQLRGRYFDDWHRGYYYKPGQYVWYNGRAWQPARPLTQPELALVPGQAPGLWLDITASIPLN